MKRKLIKSLLIISCLLATVVFASDHCTDPVADWQPKEKLKLLMEDKGWAVNRIKVDDGCYEVKGIDQNGHKVEAKFSPASLKLKELEIKFKDDGSVSEYFNR